MALTIPASKPFTTKIPEDNYLAVCIGVYDIGTVESKQYDPTERVLFLFEIPELTDEEGFPETINIEFSQSLNQKSNLYKALVSWRGKAFDAERDKDFSVKERLGKPASLLIVHNSGKGDKAKNTYANIQQISALQKGVNPPTPTRKPTYFDFADGRAVIDDGVPDFIRKKIEASPEWAALKGGRPANLPGGPPKAVTNQAPAEIIGLLNSIGLAWPYNDDDLDAVPADVMSQEQYDLMKQYSTPF